MKAKVLVLGLGISGRSAARFLLHHGAVVHGVDRNAQLLQNHADVLALRQAGMVTHAEDQLHHVQEFDLIVASPGIPPTHPLCEASRRLGKEIIGEIELGCRSIANPIVGVTGTNGKTTTTLLIAHVLKSSGRKSRALGNVGVPLTQELLSIDRDEIIVLELSSYQLETLRQRVLDAAVVLNVTPDHLDRYDSIGSYAAAKLSMEYCMKEKGDFYLEDQTFQTYGHLLKSKSVKTYGYSAECFVYTDLQRVWMRGQPVFSLPLEYQGKKSHDLENLLAAYAICHAKGVQPAEFLHALQSFKKPPHRIEWVMEKEGISYYDDSKGTNVDAVIRAVQSLQGPIVLIAGGVDKGSAYTPWLEVFASKVKYICAIGQAAKKIKQQLSGQIPVEIFSNLDEAVKGAARLAQKGDTVLLSPGCSSYDMFRDYAHRGEEFQRLVRQL